MKIWEIEVSSPERPGDLQLEVGVLSPVCIPPEISSFHDLLETLAED